MENRIRPVALGRSNWMFARCLRAGKRPAVIMSLIQSAKHEVNHYGRFRTIRMIIFLIACTLDFCRIKPYVAA